MSSETNEPSAPSPPAAPPFPINVTPSGWKGLKLYEREIATYRRELPRLLEEGEAGRHALIKGDDILSIWDTWGDAVQAGMERFGVDAPLFIKKIDPRDPQRYALLDAWLKYHVAPNY